MTNNRLPLNLRLNNPCGLRSNAGPNPVVAIVQGRCQYQDLGEGLIAGACAMWSAYHHLNARFIDQIVPILYHGQDVPMTFVVRDWENSYANVPLWHGKSDLRLHQWWRAVDFMRFWIQKQNGPAPQTWLDGGGWVHPLDLVGAMHIAGKWCAP